jgi:hypothetical protein
MRLLVSAVAGVLLATSAQAAHHKVRWHKPQPHAQAAQTRPKPPADPLYEACEFPWKRLDFMCPGISGGDGG